VKPPQKHAQLLCYTDSAKRYKILISKTYKSNKLHSYLSGNWKTIPTLSGKRDFGGSIGFESKSYFCTVMDPHVG
jgi:hypothetical protein